MFYLKVSSLGGCFFNNDSGENACQPRDVLLVVEAGLGSMRNILVYVYYIFIRCRFSKLWVVLLVDLLLYVLRRVVLNAVSEYKSFVNFPFFVGTKVCILKTF